jgi:ferredoxin
MNDEEIAIVKVDVVPADKEEAVRQTAEECPADAISVEE